MENPTLGGPRDELFGITHDFITKLRNKTISPEEAKKFLRKENPFPEKVKANTRRSSLIIDLDADPYVPEDWTVEEHRKGGEFKFDLKKIELYLADGQKKGRSIFGSALQAELRNKPVLNANVLDWLIDSNQHRIPKEWRYKFIFFWDTIYRDASGSLAIRCLSWNGSQWTWDFRWINVHWLNEHPAALFVS